MTSRTTITIPAEFFRAALLAAAKKDMRNYLNGVTLDFQKPRAVLMATDGHLLLAFYIGETPAELQGKQFFVPRDIVENIKAKHGPTVGITIDLTAETLTITDTAHGISSTVSTKLPTLRDWRRVIPEKVTGESTRMINPVYLYDMQSAGLILAKKSAGKNSRGLVTFTLYNNGTGPAVVLFNDRNDVIGLIMPLRAELGAPQAYSRPTFA